MLRFSAISCCFEHSSSKSATLKQPGLLNKIFRILLYSLLGLVVLLATITIALYANRAKLVNVFIAQANNYLAVPVSAAKIEMIWWETFPSISVKFHNLRVDPAFATEEKYLLQAEELFVGLDFWPLWEGNFIIQNVEARNGSVAIFVDSAGKQNFDILKPTDNKNNQQELELKISRILLQNMHVVYADSRNKQFYEGQTGKLSGALSYKGAITDISVKGDLFVDNIRSVKSVLVRKKSVATELSLNIDNQKNKILISTNLFKINQSGFKVNGWYSWGELEAMDISWESSETGMKTLASLVPAQHAKIFDDWDFDGNIKIKGYARGAGNNPTVYCEVKCNNATAALKKTTWKVSGFELDATYQSGSPSSLKNSTLTLANFEGNFAGKPFSVKGSIKDFTDPDIDLEGKGVFELPALSSVVGLTGWKVESGILEGDFSVKGRLSSFNKLEGLRSIKSTGHFELKNGNFFHQAKGLGITNVNSLLSLSYSDISIDKFEAQVGSSQIELNGLGKNYLGLLLGADKDVYLEANLKSNYLNLDEWLLATSSARQANEDNMKLVIPEFWKMSIRFRVDEFRFRKLQAENLKGRLKLVKQELQLADISMLAGGGSVSLNGDIVLKNKEKYVATGKLKMKDVGIDSLFYVAGDFGQDFLQYKNVSGTMSTNTDVRILFDQFLNIKANDCIAKAEVNIRNGKLMGFAPVLSLSRFFEKKELENLAFRELKNTFYIESGIVTIPEMHIQSQVFDFYISGKQTFDQEMDYRLKIPWRYFPLRLQRKGDPDAAFGEIEDKDPKGHFYLKMTGKNDNISIKPDLQMQKKEVKEKIKEEGREFLDLFKKKKKKVEEEDKSSKEEYFEFD